MAPSLEIGCSGDGAAVKAETLPEVTVGDVLADFGWSSVASAGSKARASSRRFCIASGSKSAARGCVGPRLPGCSSDTEPVLSYAAPAVLGRLLPNAAPSDWASRSTPGDCAGVE